MEIYMLRRMIIAAHTDCLRKLRSVRGLVYSPTNQACGYLEFLDIVVSYEFLPARDGPLTCCAIQFTRKQDNADWMFMVTMLGSVGWSDIRSEIISDDEICTRLDFAVMEGKDALALDLPNLMLAVP